MSYPTQLLPEVHYRLIDTEALPGGAVLLRRLDYDCAEIPLDDFGEVPATVIVGHESLSKADGLSVSLCGVYRPEHLSLRATKSETCPEPGHYWCPGDPVPRESEIVFERLKDYCPGRLKLESVHRTPFPTKNDQVGQSAERLSGQVAVEHAPTVTNFWHFEIRFYQDGTKRVGRSKSAWKRKAHAFVLRNLVTALQVGAVGIECPPIPRTLYG